MYVFQDCLQATKFLYQTSVCVGCLYIDENKHYSKYKGHIL